MRYIQGYYRSLINISSPFELVIPKDTLLLSFEIKFEMGYKGNSHKIRMFFDEKESPKINRKFILLQETDNIPNGYVFMRSFCSKEYTVFLYEEFPRLNQVK